MYIYEFACHVFYDPVYSLLVFIQSFFLSFLIFSIQNIAKAYNHLVAFIEGERSGQRNVNDDANGPHIQ